MEIVAPSEICWNLEFLKWRFLRSVYKHPQQLFPAMTAVKNQPSSAFLYTLVGVWKPEILPGRKLPKNFCNSIHSKTHYNWRGKHKEKSFVSLYVIEISLHLHKLQLWFSRLTQRINFWKLLCQWTYQMDRLLSNLKHLQCVFYHVLNST
jgi:hypothetical protein